MAEQRRRTRVEFHTKADVQAVGVRMLEVETRDLSHKGVFILGQLPLREGQGCVVTIHLPSDAEDAPVLNLEGTVARVNQDGVAIDFISMDPETYMHLRHLVLLNAEDPEVAAEEFGKPAFPDLEGEEKA